MAMTPNKDVVLILKLFKKPKARKLTSRVICSVKRFTNYITKFNLIYEHLETFMLMDIEKKYYSN